MGISFTDVGTENGILLDDLKGTYTSWDSIQVSYTDKGKTKLRDFYYSLDCEIGDDDGWYNDGLEYVGKIERLAWGQGAWLVTADPTDITTAGEVKKGHKIHTFTDPSSLNCSFYPTPFCPNSASVSWNGIASWDSIQVFYTDKGKTKLKDFYYSLDCEIGDDDGWYDDGLELLEADAPVAQVGEGFWLVLSESEEAAFTEVSPLGDEEAK